LHPSSCCAPRLLAVIFALAAVIGGSLTLTPAAVAAVPFRVADLETGDFTQFDQVGITVGALSIDSGRAYDGTHSAHATYTAAGSANGYSRGIYEVSLPEGSDLWYGAAFYLPTGFAQASSYVSLVRWDNWPTYTDGGDTCGVSLYRGDDLGHLECDTYNSTWSSDMGPGFTLPEGRWFWLEVHQRISHASGTVNEVYVDGARVLSSSAANVSQAGRAIDRIRYGIVAIDDGASPAVSLWFDRASMGPAALGPVGTSPPPPTTSPPPTSPPEPAPTPPPPPPAPPAPPANQPPSVVITSPTPYTAVGSSLRIAAEASDDHGVSRVEYRVDGRLVATQASGPWSYTYAASGLGMGWHTVTVTAFDADGLSAAASVRVKRSRKAAGTGPTTSRAVAVTSPRRTCRARARRGHRRHVRACGRATVRRPRVRN
jgi:Bacterial Ig domain/Polysaccharide lyase